MKAILIDPFNQEVKEIKIGDTLQDIYDAPDCDPFDIATFIHDSLGRTDIYVDDEGLLKESNRYFKTWNGNIYAGKGLLLDTDDEGNSTDVSVSVLQVQSSIKFLPEGFKVEPIITVNEWRL